MYNISLKIGGHHWEKQNVVTVKKRKGHYYDFMKCSKCGIQGRTTSISTIGLKQSYKRSRVFECEGNNYSIPKIIKITNCSAYGDQFLNLIPNSEHNVINPPLGYKNSINGVWVMGVCEPVMVLPEEYEVII